MIKKYHKLLLLGIVCISIFLRFWQLGTLPPALTWDETSWGYNGYTIGIDGKDEFGKMLPYEYLESFGDFKPPLYAYATVIPIKIFGLQEFAVRFPSAFFGVLTVLVTYFLVKRLFYKSPLKEEYALMSSFILAVSPWHIMLSRAAFEANVATFFLVSGIYFFFAAIQNKQWYLLFSAICFSLSFYTFNTARIVAPLFVIALVISSYKTLLKMKKQVIVAIGIGIVLLLPLVPFLMSPNASLRFKEVNIFTNLDIVKASNEQIADDENTILGKIIHNRRIGFGHEYLKHYFDNLSLNFLFLEGDGNPKFSVQSVGQMYLWDLLFFFLGLGYLFKIRDKNAWFLPVWILLGIIPAATARETPHALRIETTLPAFQIIVAYGFVNVLQEIKRIQLRNIIASVLFILLGINIFFFLHDYSAHYTKRFSSDWQYGFSDAMKYVYQHSQNYKNVYISESIGRPYIYFLFYNNYSPNGFRKNALIERDSFGFVHVKQIGKYHFLSVLPQEIDSMYVISPTPSEDYRKMLPNGAKILQTIHRPDGTVADVIYSL